MMTVPGEWEWRTIQDSKSKHAAPEQCFPGVHGSVPPLVDVPIETICERLYSGSSANEPRESGRHPHDCSPP